MNLESRVLLNIQIEAELFVRGKGKMGTRDLKWNQATADAIAKAKAEYGEELRMVEEIELSKVRAKEELMASKSGLTYDEWLTQAKKYYTIDPASWVVISVAKSPNVEPEQWTCKTEIKARKKVLQLLEYKFRDHFERGRDFAWTKE